MGILILFFISLNVNEFTYFAFFPVKSGNDEDKVIDLFSDFRDDSDEQYEICVAWLELPEDSEKPEEEVWNDTSDDVSSKLELKIRWKNEYHKTEIDK